MQTDPTPPTEHPAATIAEPCHPGQDCDSCRSVARRLNSDQAVEITKPYAITNWKPGLPIDGNNTDDPKHEYREHQHLATGVARYRCLTKTTPTKHATPIPNVPPSDRTTDPPTHLTEMRREKWRSLGGLTARRPIPLRNWKKKKRKQKTERKQKGQACVVACPAL